MPARPRPIVACFLGLAVLTVGGARARAADDVPASPTRQQPTTTAAGQIRRAPTTLPAESLPPLYTVPAFALPTHRGQTIGDKDLRGKVWVAAFFFTRCGGKCPTVATHFVALQKRVTSADLAFVSFSVDPEDTIEDLRAFAAKFNPDETRWHVARTGDRAAIDAMARGMRVGAGDDAPGGYDLLHADRYLLVDGRGRVRGEYSPWKEEHRDRLAKDVQRLLAAASTEGP